MLRSTCRELSEMSELGRWFSGALLTALCLAGTAFGAEPLPAPTITPPGGTFTEAPTVTIEPPVLQELQSVGPAWMAGFKYPGQGIESVFGISNDGTHAMALRARTNSSNWWTFAGVNLRRADGAAFPFYVWSLTDFDTGFPPDLFAGAVDNTNFDGTVYDPYFGETGNRVFRHPV